MASCLMVGALAFGGTMAYLTDTEGATNTFTVGKVQIDLEEPGYPGNTDDSVKNLVPNQEIEKDPQVIGIGNPGPGGCQRFDSPEEICTEGRKFLYQSPQLFDVFNILLLMISERCHDYLPFLLYFFQSLWNPRREMASRECCQREPRGKSDP